MEVQYHNFTFGFMQELLHFPQDRQQWGDTNKVMVYPEPGASV
jgi:hypothetical protein